MRNLSLFAPTEVRCSKLNRCIRMYDVFKYRFLPLHVSRTLTAVAFYAHAIQIEHRSRINIQLHCDDSIYSLSE